MPYTLDDKLVIAVSSTALFDFSEADQVFQEHNEEAYMAYQRRHVDVPARPGVAFKLVEKLLRLNSPEHSPVEVILVSRNDPFSGLRVFRSSNECDLAITRGVFTGGANPFPYVRPVRPVLYLSTDEGAVREALAEGIPAARVGLQAPEVVDKYPDELRLAFDGDGVLFDDSSERIYQRFGIQTFHDHESSKAKVPLNPGPLKPFVDALKQVQAATGLRNRLALITARNAPSHERALRTLDAWGIQVHEAMFLGGLEKAPFIQAFAPDIFFDDQRTHIEPAAGIAAVAHVPFGVSNEGRAGR